MLRRIWSRVENKIPNEQAAYQGGRGTTEQVLSLKLMVEKALSSSDLQIYIELLDMSKAFDTVNRQLLFEHLETILEPDELHILSLLTNAPNIKIQLEQCEGPGFTSYQGIMQGDCLSAVLFIYYLSCALAHEAHEIPSTICPPKCHTDDICTCEAQTHAGTGEKPSTTNINHDHTYSKSGKNENQKKERNHVSEKPIPDINPKYADDITYITISAQRHQNRERITTERLKPYNLTVNSLKTEKYIAPEIPNTSSTQQQNRDILWSDLDWTIPKSKPPIKAPPQRVLECKLLGSKIGTVQDIKNRKCNVIPAIRANQKYFNSKIISKEMKIRIFNTYVEPIMLYNSEIWNMNKTLNNSIDAYQRRLLRQALNIKHPEHMTNNKLYKITKAVPWSRKIKERRLNLLGHVLRLPSDTPIQKALQANTITSRNKVGRPKSSWINTVLDDLKAVPNMTQKLYPQTLNELIKCAKEREVWRDLVKGSMSGTE